MKQGSAPHTMTFRVQVRLNSLFHPDAISLLHSIPKENLADAIATILQHGARAQSSGDSGNSLFRVVPMGAASTNDQSAPDTDRTKTAAASALSTTPGVTNPNPLAAAGFDMVRAAEAFAIPTPRTH